jgi:hypothetical protein
VLQQQFLDLFLAKGSWMDLVENCLVPYPRLLLLFFKLLTLLKLSLMKSLITEFSNRFAALFLWTTFERDSLSLFVLNSIIIMYGSLKVSGFNTTILNSSVYDEATSLAGKSVAITGGNTGLGKETAVKLAGLGADVIILCRNPTNAQAAVAEIKERSGWVYYVAKDIKLNRQNAKMALMLRIIELCAWSASTKQIICCLSYHAVNHIMQQYTFSCYDML